MPYRLTHCCLTTKIDHDFCDDCISPVIQSIPLKPAVIHICVDLLLLWWPLLMVQLFTQRKCGNTLGPQGVRRHKISLSSSSSMAVQLLSASVGDDQNSSLLTLTHVSLLTVTTERQPLVVHCNENTFVAGYRQWITALPVAVLHVNFTSVYMYMLTDLHTRTCMYFRITIY